MAITKTTAGLLARNEYDNGSFPFDTADVDLPADKLTVALVSGELVFTLDPGGVGSVIRAARFNDFTARNGMFVQYILKTEKLGGGSNFVAVATCANVEDHTTGSEDLVRFQASVQRFEPTGPDVNGTSRYVAGTSSTVIAQTDISPWKTHGTGYRFSHRTSGTSVRTLDFTAANEQTGTATASVAGRDGVLLIQVDSVGTMTATVLRRFVCTSEYVTVVGVPTGGSAEVRSAADVVKDSAAESGGTATLDLFDVDLENAAKLVVKNSGGTIVDSYQVSGSIIEPGGTYTYVPEPGAFTSPAAGSQYAAGASVVATWGASSGSSIEYELQIGNTGTGWTAVVTQAGLTKTYTLTQPDGVYQFRVRARNTVTSAVSDWVYSEGFLVGTLEYAELVASHEPIEYWRLEETSGDFLRTAPGEYNADPGVQVSERGIDAICNGIRAVATGGDAAQILLTKRTYSSATFNNNFGFEQWVDPSSTGSKPVLLWSQHGGESGSYGLGLAVSTTKVQVCLQAHNFINGSFDGLQPDGNYNTDSLTSYTGSELLANDWNHIAVEVETSSAITIRLYLNGVYCDDLSGTYTEFSRTIGQPMQISGSMQPNLVSVFSWPDYARRAIIVGNEPIYGQAWAGDLDEVAWYDYVPGAAVWASHYDAGRATLDASPAGAFTNPLAGSTQQGGTSITVAWGAASGATGYLLEVSYDGAAYVTVATPATNSYAHTLPATATESVTYRVTPLYSGYAPEDCVSASVTSGVFSIMGDAEDPPPAVISEVSPCPPDTIQVTTIARLETWSDSKFNGGTRTGFIPDFLTVTDRRELGGEESCIITIPRESARNEAAGVWERLTPNIVIRTVYRWRRDSPYRRMSWEEWRMPRVKDGRDENDATVAELALDAMHYDLRRVLMRRTEANGLVQMQYGDYGRTPTQHVDAILDRVDDLFPGYFSRGIIEPTDLVDIDYSWDNARSALGKLEAACVGYELHFGRNCEGYQVHLLDATTAPTLPDLTASFTSAKVGLVVSFNASGSTSPGAEITSYAWDFGDGGDGNHVNPSHTYASGGTYTVVLTVTDNVGRQDTYSANVTVP